MTPGRRQLQRHPQARPAGLEVSTVDTTSDEDTTPCTANSLSTPDGFDSDSGSVSSEILPAPALGPPLTELSHLRPSSTPKNTPEREGASPGAAPCTYRECSVQARPQMVDCATQWEDNFSYVSSEHCYATKAETTTKSAETQTASLPLYETLSEADCSFYTGLNLDAFSKLVISVSAVHRSGTMSIGDQVLMTLMRLRLSLLYRDLAR